MAAYLFFLKVLMAGVGTLFLISGIDDLFIDVYYYVSRLYRWMFISWRYPKLTEAELKNKPEKSIALMVPAWNEEAVIEQMLRHTSKALDYRNYEIFVGTYPNDPATRLKVEEVGQTDSRVHAIVCDNPGPTSKADCLNAIIEGIRRYEIAHHKHFAVFMLHDSEDIVHPLSFKLVNFLTPRFPMIQLPVIPLERPLSHLTGGTYLDEFAEWHLKDILVREKLNGMVPSAGVGTGFSREAIDQLAAKYGRGLFNVNSFTEDYDFAFRIQELAQRSILSQFFVQRMEMKRGFFGREKLKVVNELVATRAYFPDKFGSAVRQKTRWILGIVFQGWTQIGWRGGTAQKYMIWRDRKAMISNIVNMLGYVLLAFLIYNWAYNKIQGWEVFPPVVSQDSWIWKVIVIDTLLLFNRWLQKIAVLLRVSNGKQAFLSLPRIVWGNVVNFCAVASAWRLMLLNIFAGKKLVWSKTEHAFPTENEITRHSLKLGELLLQNRSITFPQLSDALKKQQRNGKRLGDVLVEDGVSKEEEIVEALAAQVETENVPATGRRVGDTERELIPELAAREHQMLALDADKRPVLVAAAEVDPEMQRWLDAHLGQPYRVVVVGSKRISGMIQQVYAPLPAPPPQN